MPIEKLFKDFMQSSSGQGAFGGAASGAIVSMLMNKKSRKKLGSTAVNIGGVAAVAGLGYYAYQKWLAAKGGEPSGAQAAAASGSPATARDLQSAQTTVIVDQSLAAKLLLAMVAATAADGSIDPTEMDRLLESMDQAGLDSKESAKLTAALNEPPTVEEIATLADNPEQASELYIASLSAIDLDTPAEHLYLRRLARSLSLEPSLVIQLHKEAEALPA